MERRFRRRASAVVVHGDLILAVRLQDPTTGVTQAYPPGGAVEPGERPAQTAARETREETGYDVVIDEASEVVARYDFVWDGAVVDCETLFYRGRLVGAWTPPVAVEDAAYHRGAVWLQTAEIRADFGYDRAICEAVARLTGIV